MKADDFYGHRGSNLTLSKKNSIFFEAAADDGDLHCFSLTKENLVVRFRVSRRIFFCLICQQNDKKKESPFSSPVVKGAEQRLSL